MSSPNEIPEDLRDVVDHARRLATLLLRAEEENKTSIWLCGRAAEVRANVSCTLKDWRSGVSNTDMACVSLSQYLDTIHRGLSRRLGGAALSCCDDDELDPFGMTGTITTARRGSFDSVEGTLRKAWEDGPDILALVKREMTTVNRCAKSLARRIGNACPREDLEAFGREGLLNAARSFNEQRGIAFSVWANVRIYSAMVSGVRRWGGVRPSVLKALIEESRAEERRVADGEYSPPSTKMIAKMWSLPDEEWQKLPAADPTPEEDCIHTEFVELLQTAVNDLPQEQGEILRRYYSDDVTFNDVGAAMKITPNWATKQHSNALARLRQTLRRRQGDWRSRSS